MTAGRGDERRAISVTRHDACRIGRRAFVCSLLGGLGGLAGCSLFSASATKTLTTQRPFLPPIRPSDGSIPLEILIAQRPSDDPLIGSSLWQGVDQIGATSAETRAWLSPNGLRVGVVGSVMPPLLQELLGMSIQWDQQPGEKTGPEGRRLFLPSGNATQILLDHPPVSFDLQLERDGDRTTQHYEDARIVWKMTPRRLSEGWAKLEFAPEVHHGAERLRHAATTEGWAYQNGQHVTVLHRQRFDVTLNDGELVVIGCIPGLGKTLGERSLLTEGPSAKQSLIVVRLLPAV